MKSKLSKLVFLFLAVSLVALVAMSFTVSGSGCDLIVITPDGSTCTWLLDEEGPFGPRGVYTCKDDLGQPYTGYGDACSLPPSIQP